MARKVITEVRRTGNSSSVVRKIAVKLEDGTEQVLSTQIKKVDMGLKFRHGGARVPMEQYAFEVQGRRVHRFADALALVFRRHHVRVAPSALEQAQTYVQKAVQKAENVDDIQFITA